MKQLSIAGGVIVVVALATLLNSQAPPAQTATVHVRLVTPRGEQMVGETDVRAFKSYDNGQDLASTFRNGVAAAVPFGTYRLQAYTTGFWSTEIDVSVTTSDVWVVTSLEPGTEGGPLRYQLRGRVANRPGSDEPMWVRLSGVYARLSVDTRVTATGDFLLVELPSGPYTMVVTRGTEILDVRIVQIPTRGVVEINLAGSPAN
jgi:hypothetical protein